MKALPPSVPALLDRMATRLRHRPKLAELFVRCYPNTLETTVETLDDGSTYVITGDIPAMWLRDSSAQVRPYLPLASGDPEMQKLLEGVIRRQWMYIALDPYANAFRRKPGSGPNDWIGDLTDHSPWEFERKYELDSLCYPIQLAYLYWKTTGLTRHLDAAVGKTLNTVVDLWKTEQHHGELSPYRFTRLGVPEQDTLHNEGRGQPVNWTGMTWSGFRPSDDACRFGYLIPSNLFAVTVLGYVAEMAGQVFGDPSLAAKAGSLAVEIDRGLRFYGTFDHPLFGRIWAQETDGFGNYVLADDANIPSLLSLPYLGCCDAADPLYQNTRRFILSLHNPFYFDGRAARGIGSPHTPRGYVWHLSLVMQGLTSKDPQEIYTLLDMVEASHAGTGYMHEGFHCDDPTRFTRPWFAWANSLFGEWVVNLVDRGVV